MAPVSKDLPQRIVPTRGAAQKAMASFAEQLTDSPGRSDVDDSPTTSNPFREPTQRAKSVKYRYTATGKHLSSPLKGTPSSPERKQDNPKKFNLTILTPPSPSHLSKDEAFAVATTSRKRKASISRDDLLDSLFSLSPLSSIPSSPVASTKDLPPSPTFTPKDLIPSPLMRRPALQTVPLHHSGNKGSLLSQPPSPNRKTKTNTQTNAADAWAVGNFAWIFVNQSGVLADSCNPEPGEPLMWWPAKVVQKQPLRVLMFGNCPSSPLTHRGYCTISAPTPSVIQSINDHTGAKRFSLTTFCLSFSKGRLPKKPRLDGALMGGRWECAVLSLEDAMRKKQGLPPLTQGSIFDPLDDSDSDMSDFTQLLLESKDLALKKSKSTESPRKPKVQRSGAKSNTDKRFISPPTRHSSPCPPDPTLEIPGELILALAPRTGSSYWPAQILEHVPDAKEKYLVKFLDDRQHVITRDKFWTSDEEGFVRCKLGRWESPIKTIDDPESDDEDEEFSIRIVDPRDLDEAALPPPPPPAEDFENLSIRAQLAYVKPVLRAILNKTYAPALRKHDAFMRGGSARVALMKSAGVRGRLDARFVRAVQKVICQWVLGDRGIRPERLDIGDIETGNGDAEGSAPVKSTLQLLAEVSQAVATEPSLLPSHPELPKLNDITRKDTSSQPSPLTPIVEEDQPAFSRRTTPVVCGDFEVLSGIGKLDYCLNILLPESIQQLLLWRSGERTSLELLAPEEEQRLHDVGAQMAVERDWVDDVMNLREAQARLLDKKAKQKTVVVQGGTRSRPRRATVSRP